MSTAPAAKLDILIDIQAKLGDLLKVQQEFREAKREGNAFGEMLKQGLGIGSGMEMARRGIELVKGVLRESVGEAFRMSSQLKDVSQNLSISTDALQVLTEVVKDNGGEFETLTMAITSYRGMLDQVRNGNTAASNTFRELGLTADELSRLPLELQMEKLARAIMKAGNESRAFDQAVSILGSRNAPKLMQTLRELAEQGYGGLDKAMKESGRIMGQDTIDRLDKAQKELEKFKRALVIGTGETIAAMDMLKQSAQKNFVGTAWATMKAALFNDYSGLGTTLAENIPAAPAAPSAPVNTAPRATTEEMINARLQFTAQDIARVTDSALATELEKRPRLIALLQEQERLYAQLLELKYADVIGMKDGDQNPTKEQLVRLQEKSKLEAEINKNRSQQRTVAGQGPAAFTKIAQWYFGANDSTVNPNAMTAGQGLSAGPMQWVTQLGSTGEQVAATLNSTIGSSVTGISQGIYGWATGTKQWGESLMEIGSSVFQMMLQMLVQIGVQQALNFILLKTGLVATDALQSTLLAKKTVEVNAANAATMPANTANAAAASVSSFGVAAVLGIAAMLAMMAMFGGFRAGGGPVDSNRPYVVGERGPELFFPRASGSIISNETFTRMSPGLGAAAPMSAAKPRVYLAMASTQAQFDEMSRLPGYEVHHVDIVHRNRGTLLG